MLFSGWEVRIVKNCDRVQLFQVRGHSFSLNGPTLSRQITYIFPSFKTKKINSRKKAHASVTVTALRTNQIVQEPITRYQARLEKNKTIYCISLHAGHYGIAYHNTTQYISTIQLGIHLLKIT